MKQIWKNFNEQFNCRCKKFSNNSIQVNSIFQASTVADIIIIEFRPFVLAQRVNVQFPLVTALQITSGFRYDYGDAFSINSRTT
ncbi:hypothetical protein CEXT_296491 [Caerostris extrusa]|uniref:Uncharacterized protein n=1 Tax=Caerostris extrusa TaxID=172846 RepID=A0AAV4P083_CAEEX|nr:hypothetical protein CEXT_296491 [Caerostris extrusa]